MTETKAAPRCKRRKYRHPTPESAELHLASMEIWNARHGRSRPGWFLDVYWCEPCGAYHIGHKKLAPTETTP